MAAATPEVVCCWVDELGCIWQRPQGLGVLSILCVAAALPTPAPANRLVVPVDQDGSLGEGKVEYPGGGSAKVGTPTAEVLAVVSVVAAIEA